MRKSLAAAAALLLASGCDRPQTPPAAAPADAPTSAPTPAPDVPPPAVPAVVVLVDAAGAQAAPLSCGAEGLQMFVPRFRPIGSEDRLSIGRARPSPWSPISRRRAGASPPPARQIPTC